jgi:hypothetical protein
VNPAKQPAPADVIRRQADRLVDESQTIRLKFSQRIWKLKQVTPTRMRRSKQRWPLLPNSAGGVGNWIGPRRR